MLWMMMVIGAQQKLTQKGSILGTKDTGELVDLIVLVNICLDPYS